MNPRYILNAKGVRFDGAVCEGGNTNPTWTAGEFHSFEWDTENDSEVLTLNLYDGAEGDAGVKIAWAEIKLLDLAKNAN